MRFFAYLDPGTGTIIVQAVLGGTAGAALLFKTVGGKFRRKSKVDQPTDIAGELESTEADEPSAPPVAGD